MTLQSTQQAVFDVKCLFVFFFCPFVELSMRYVYNNTFLRFISLTCLHMLSDPNVCFVFSPFSLMSGVKNNVGRGINIALVNGKNNYCTLSV